MKREEPMTYEHYVLTDEPEQLASRYQRAGYLAEVGSDGDLVMVYSDYTDDDRRQIQQIAADSAADYDGGGMFMKAPTT